MRDVIYSLIILAFCFVGLPSACQEDGQLTAVDNDQALREIRTMGRLYLETGLYDDAIKYFSNILSKQPRLYYAFYGKGLAYYGKGEMDNAESALLKAVEINPYYAEAYYHLALVEHRRGNSEKIIEYLNMVSSLDNTFQRAYYNKGVTYLKLDMLEEAMKEFSYALYLEPKDLASINGLLECCERLDYFEVDRESAKDTVKVIFPDYAKFPMPNVSDSMMYSDKPDKIYGTYLFSSMGKKEIEMIKGEPIELRRAEGVNSALEISFHKPNDLHNKLLGFQIKGALGNEKMSVLLRDRDTKRSPMFHVNDIGREWKPFALNLENIAYNIDLGNVEHIKFEIISSENKENIPSEDESVPTILIKDIEIM